MSIIAFTCFFYDAGVNDITFQRSSGVVEDGLIGFTCRLQGSVFGNIEWLFSEELLFGSKVFLDDETVAVIALYFVYIGFLFVGEFRTRRVYIVVIEVEYAMCTCCILILAIIGIGGKKTFV